MCVSFRNFVAALCVMAGLPAYGDTVIEMTAANRYALGVETVEVQEDTSTESVFVSGNVIAAPGAGVPIITPIDATLVKPHVLPGVSLKKGSTVATLYSAEFATELGEYNNKLAMAEHTQELLERDEELFKLGRVPEKEFDETKHHAIEAKIALASQKARLAGLVAAAKPAQFNIQTTDGGKIIHIELDAGTEFEAGDVIATLLKDGPLWAKFSVPAAISHQLSKGTEVRLSGVNTTGILKALDPEIDPATRSVEVFVELPVEKNWRIGELVSGRFTHSNAQALVTMPAKALVQIQGQPSVFVETEGGFVVTPVNVKHQSIDKIWVDAGLSAGSQVAISGLAAMKNLVEGM